MTQRPGTDAALALLLAAVGLEAKAAVLSAHQEALLDGSADYLPAARATDDVPPLMIALTRTLLAACHEHGIAKGVANFRLMLVDAWFVDDELETKAAVLAAWSDPLLSDSVLTAFSTAESGDDPAVAARAAWHRRLLERCRRDGAESGFAEHLGREQGGPPPLPSRQSQNVDPQSLLEELEGLTVEDRPESWPRQIEILEALLEGVPATGDDELVLFRAGLASNLANTLHRSLEAGLVEPVHTDSVRLRARALYDGALATFRGHERWIDVATTAQNQAILFAVAFQAGDGAAALPAHALYDEALAIFRRHKRWIEVAGTAQNQANLFLAEFEAGDGAAAPRAHALYDEALAISRRHERWIDVAQTAQNQANLFLAEFRAGDGSAAPRAHALYDEALTISRRHERWIEVAGTAQNQANLFQAEFWAGDRAAAPRAHALYDEALEIRRDHKRWIDVAQTAQNQANLFLAEYLAGDRAAAKRAHVLYDEARTISRGHERWIDVATTAQNQANLFAAEFRAGDGAAAPRAHALYDEALSISRRHERWIDVAQTADNQANLFLAEFEAGARAAAERAHALYDEALTIRRGHERWIDVAQTAQNQANLFQAEFRAGDGAAAKRAHPLYDEALAIFRRHERWIDLAQTAQNQANLFQAGDRAAAPRAHALYDEALAIFRRHERWIEVAQTAQNQANLFLAEFRAGDRAAAPRAHALFNEALAIFRRHERWIDVSTTAQNQANLFAAEIQAGDRAAAERAHALYNEALAIRRRHKRWIEVAGTAQNQANLFLGEFRAGDRAAASRAHALYDEAARLMPYEARPIQNLMVRRNLLDLLLAEENWAAATEVAEIMQADVRRRLPALASPATRRRLLGALRGTAMRGCAAALARGDVDSAVTLLEGGRTVELGARLRQAEARLNANERTSLEAARSTLQMARKDFETALADLPSGGVLGPDRHAGARAARVRAAEMRLAEQNAEFEALRRGLRLDLDRPPPTPMELRQVIGPDAALVQLWTGSRSGGALILLPGTERWQPVPLPALTEAAVGDLLRDWFAAYGRFDLDLRRRVAVDEAAARFSPAIEQGCRTLWRLVMGPLRDALAESGHTPADGAEQAAEVVLCPPGWLSVLPLHAALDPDRDRPFLHDYAVRYVPSLGACLTTGARGRLASETEGALVAVTNPQDDLAFWRDGKFVPVMHNPALPFFPQDRRIDLCGYRAEPSATDVATAERLRREIAARRPSCVSVYCHGGWDPRVAENSAIYLAAPLDQDGKIPVSDGRTLAVPLSVAELRELPLNGCRLFILAGCETGMIDLSVAPDEFIGLPAAVLEAGAAAALASLWPVETEGTYALIDRVLADRRDRGDSLVQAVRRAQMALRDDPQAFSGIGQSLAPGAAGDHPLLNRTACPRPPYLWAAFSLVGA